MKRHILCLAAAIPLVVGSAARADDASDCNRALSAPDAAITACTRMLDRAGGENARKLLLLRSRAYAAKQLFDAALADAAQMAVVAPAKWYTAVMARAYVHDAMKDYDAAIADYTELLNANPQDYYALSNRCSERSRSPRDASEALADCNAAVAAFNGPGPDLCTRGLVSLRLGRFNDALADYDLFLAGTSPYAQCYYGRGIAKLKLGDLEGSKADIAKGLALQNDVAKHFSPFGLTP